MGACALGPVPIGVGGRALVVVERRWGGTMMGVLRGGGGHCVFLFFFSLSVSLVFSRISSSRNIPLDLVD